MTEATAAATERFDIAHPGRYWHKLDDGRLQCDICPRFCKLHEGQRGLCFVRGRQDDQVVLTTYGRSSGFCVDPIEKKPLNHFLPGTPVLSFGTAGCNLTCKFCQNWDISKSREFHRLACRAGPHGEEIAAAAGTRPDSQAASLSPTTTRSSSSSTRSTRPSPAMRARHRDGGGDSAGYVCENRPASRILRGTWTRRTSI